MDIYNYLLYNEPTRRGKFMKIAEMIRYLRLRDGLSQRDLAAKIHVSPSAIGMYESGQRFPTQEVEEALADYFNVSLDVLRGISEEHSYNENVRSFASLSENMQKRLLAYYNFFLKYENGEDGEKGSD